VEDEDRVAADELREQARATMGAPLAVEGVHDLLLGNPDHPRWDDVAARCLGCANCTLVCPTCFCSSVEYVADLTGAEAERDRVWDSCFSIQYSELHGGSTRTSTRSRYRQWLTHKLGTWQDQFGELGCVGCGRCITWCPAGIDLRDEIAALKEAPK
jgi:ferredoxin